MNLTVQTLGSDETVTAPIERWLCGLIAMLPDDQRAKLMRLVASRVEIGTVPGHVIGVPSVIAGAGVGVLGGGGK